MPKVIRQKTEADLIEEQRDARLAEFSAGFQVSRSKPRNRWQRHGSLFMVVYANDNNGPFHWLVTDQDEGTKDHSDREPEFETRDQAYESLFFRFVEEVY